LIFATFTGTLHINYFYLISGNDYCNLFYIIYYNILIYNK